MTKQTLKFKGTPESLTCESCMSYKKLPWYRCYVVHIIVSCSFQNETL